VILHIYWFKTIAIKTHSIREVMPILLPYISHLCSQIIDEIS
jgi:hypothetical protein